jgi:exopolyphosphatase/pppGpp-phosphohydrolase
MEILKLLKAVDVGSNRIRLSLISIGSHYVGTAGLPLGFPNEIDRPEQLVRRPQRYVQQNKSNVQLSAVTATLSGVKK